MALDLLDSASFPVSPWIRKKMRRLDASARDDRRVAHFASYFWGAGPCGRLHHGMERRAACTTNNATLCERLSAVAASGAARSRPDANVHRECTAR